MADLLPENSSSRYLGSNEGPFEPLHRTSHSPHVELMVQVLGRLQHGVNDDLPRSAERCFLAMGG
jgi:hypothetical protein